MEIQRLPVLRDNYVFVLVDRAAAAAAVVDPAVANKPISPLMFFIKRMRLGKTDWEADKKILEVLKDNEVKVTTDSDKLGMHKQVARLFSTDMAKKD